MSVQLIALPISLKGWDIAFVNFFQADIIVCYLSEGA